MQELDLEELGLTGNESKVYKTLVEFGKLGAGEISGRSGVSYSRIYDLLESLIGKGLVVVVPEKTKKFIPGSPEALLKLLEEKEKRILHTKEKLKELKQFYEVKEKNPVVMGIGKKGFYKIVEEAKQGQKYSYSIRWTSEFRGDWVESVRKVLKKGVNQRFLVRYDEETKKNVHDWLKVHKNIKKFENEGIALSVVDDEEVMIALIKSDVTLLIRNKAFAKMMKKLYLAAYEKAEKIA